MKAVIGIWVVLAGHRSFGLFQYAGNVIFQMVGTGLIFEITPEPLDWVEIGAVSRQPDHHHPMLKQTESGQSRGSFLSDSSGSAVWTLASLSCKWPRSCFGRRYRYPFRYFGLLASPSMPSRYQRFNQPYTFGMLIACILAISSGLCSM